MSKYEIKDAIMLKECMKQIAAIRSEYPGMYLSDRLEEDPKEAIEFIAEMVEKGV